MFTIDRASSHALCWRTLGVTTLIGLATLAASGLASGCGDTKPSEHQASKATEAHKESVGNEQSETRVILTQAAEQTAGIVVETLSPAPPQSLQASLIVPGTVETDPRRVAIISSRLTGRLERTTVVEGDRVAAGQTVGYLYSALYLTAQSDYHQAIRRANALHGTEDAQGADALVEAARRRLAQLGVSSSEIARLAASGEPRDLLTLTAPFAGSILNAHVLPGSAVEAGTPVFRIADLSMVDVIASVPERAVASVRIGQPATVTIAAYPTIHFAGHVERLRDMLDSTTRTIGAVVHVLNPSHALRPGMYATVALRVPSNTIATAGARITTPGGLLTAPTSAVVTDGSQSYIFVQVAPHTYERRAVTATALAPTRTASTSAGTPAKEERVALAGDIRAGEQIVVRGAFTLKSELAKAAFTDED